LFLFQLDTLLFFFLHLQFFIIILYMFWTGWSIIRRIKLHVQHRVIWFSWWWTSWSEICRE